MDGDLRDELLRVKARESRFKKEAESRISELEAVLQKALERGENADSHAAQLLEAEAVIAAHKRDLEEAAKREKSLRDQISLILKEAAKEKEHGDSEIGELKKKLGAAQQKMSAGEKSAKKEQETLAKTLQSRIAALEKELDETRAAKKAMAASVDTAAAERVKLEHELECAHAGMTEIRVFARVSLGFINDEKKSTKASKGDYTEILVSLVEIARIQIGILQEISKKISPRQRGFHTAYTIETASLCIEYKNEILPLLKSIEPRVAAQRVKADWLIGLFRILEIAENYSCQNEPCMTRQKALMIESCLAKLRQNNNSIFTRIEDLGSAIRLINKGTLSQAGGKKLLATVHYLEKTYGEIIQAINDCLGGK